MQTRVIRSLGRFLLSTGAAAVVAVVAHAAPPYSPSSQNVAPSAAAPAITRRQTSIDHSGNYRQELRACQSAAAGQARESCLEEARNAHAARRNGNLQRPGEDYMANALSRCKPFAGQDLAACEARVLGFGNTSGSVAGGGMLRWVETVVLPPNQQAVTFAPKTSEPVVVIPMTKK